MITTARKREEERGDPCVNTLHIQMFSTAAIAIVIFDGSNSSHPKIGSSSSMSADTYTKLKIYPWRLRTCHPQLSKSSSKGNISNTNLSFYSLLLFMFMWITLQLELLSYRNCPPPCSVVLPLIAVHFIDLGVQSTIGSELNLCPPASLEIRSWSREAKPRSDRRLLQLITSIY